MPEPYASATSGGTGVGAGVGPSGLWGVGVGGWEETEVVVPGKGQRQGPSQGEVSPPLNGLLVSVEDF